MANQQPEEGGLISWMLSSTTGTSAPPSGKVSPGPLIQKESKDSLPAPSTETGRSTSPRPSFKRTQRINVEDEFDKYVEAANPFLDPRFRRSLTFEFEQIKKTKKPEKPAEEKPAEEKPGLEQRQLGKSTPFNYKMVRRESIILPEKPVSAPPPVHRENPFWYLRDSAELYKNDPKNFPSLNVLILIVGSRGDIQPFMVLAQGLINAGHRVRMGTHEQFRDFVGRIPEIEFVDIRGDPKKMMEFIVKNPSMITVDFNEIREQQSIMSDIFDGCWEASQIPRDGKPYNPDVLICNPPIIVHVQLAERLGIPLQLWFTMPWSPTETYKHPFAWMGSSLYSNKNSYALVDLISYSGNSSSICEWREKHLNLPPMLKGGAGVQHKVKVPHVYCFSEMLVPRPPDWGPQIGIVGFLFPSSKAADEYEPPPELLDFLAGGDPPIYIGFGSIVVNDPERLGNIILGAIARTGRRCILSQGWMGLGGDNLPPNIFPIGNCPHDWLFPRCSAVCHHGGAGTTSTGLLFGRPTIIIPFFGDQPFWGEIVHRMKVGPAPIMNTDLTIDSLTAAIEACYSDEILNSSRVMGHKLRIEDSVTKAVDTFHKYLPVDKKGRFYWRLYEHEKFDGSRWVPRQSREPSGDIEGWIRRHPGDIHPGEGWSFKTTWLANKTATQTDSKGWSYSDQEDGDDARWMGEPDGQPPRNRIYRRRMYERWAVKDKVEEKEEEEN